MRSSVAIVALCAAAVSAGYANTTDNCFTTTEVVPAVTTYCSEATTLTYGTDTYTVSKAATLTIPECTLTKTYSTEVVPAVTTYCSEATTLTHGTETYTVPAATTFTIPECTLTKSYTSAPTVAPTYTQPAKTYTPPAVHTYPVATGTGVPPSYGNGTTSGHSTPAATPSNVYTGAANRATVAGGALAGLLGVAVYLL